MPCYEIRSSSRQTGPAATWCAPLLCTYCTEYRAYTSGLAALEGWSDESGKWNDEDDVVSLNHGLEADPLTNAHVSVEIRSLLHLENSSC